MISRNPSKRNMKVSDSYGAISLIYAHLVLCLMAISLSVFKGSTATSLMTMPSVV